MKKAFIIVLLLHGVLDFALAQRTTLNNYTGIWENNASWVSGQAPPVADPSNITATHLDVTINGYITRTGDINIAGATITENFIINDTLVLIGDFYFNNDAAELIIGPNGVLIVIGNVEFRNNTRVTNSGIFAVSGNATFANGASEVYDDSGGGELFVQGNVTNNPAAQGADNWGNLDTIYPVIYDFILCGGGSSCALPITLSYFQGKFVANAVELTWATTMERNFLGFVIQRSSDGISFEEIGEVAGRGFDVNEIVTQYSYRDISPIRGANYYRLKSVDLDESFQFSRVVRVSVKAPPKLEVFPNPSSGSAIRYQINFNPGEADRVALQDGTGKVIFNVEANRFQAAIEHNPALAPGVYHLRYISKDFNEGVRVVIKP